MWKAWIETQKKEPYFQTLQSTIEERYKTSTVYPPKSKIFRAFELTPFDNLKIVIIGQDPYHGENQAQGLAFSTPKEVKNPPSLRNILQEIQSDTGKPSLHTDGDLSEWAKQGVLLINTILTVEKGKPKSHHHLGWEQFTENTLKYINENFEGILFLLWGNDAIKMRQWIDQTKHTLLTAPHPSPLSSYRGFFGCKHFSQANAILRKMGKEEIRW